MVSDTFHPPFGVLFSFPSPYWCAIGLGTYLALEGDTSHLPPPYPRRSNLELGPALVQLSLRDYHPLWQVFPDLFEFVGQGGGPALNTTSEDGFPRPVRFGLLPFHSPLLRESRLIFFPRPTKMFQFGRFPHPFGVCLLFERRLDLQFGNPRIKGRLLLPGDYRSLPRP